MDECMEIVRGLTAGGYFEFHGEFYDIPPIKISPTPTRPIPLLVGGHADAALRRAVLRGDGWMHGGGPNEQLDELLGKIAAIRKAEGVQDKPFEIHVISAEAYTADGVKRLAERGVTDVIVGFRIPYIVGPDTEPLAKKIEHLNRYSDNVIAKVS
jgi:alkanesulfonate monooxygenase SsuD/methylene tetrahydromethanopterin reductase-like flavin-dependent oxidoreductase (luciferase family)